jgi:hypothetical protein
MAGQLLLFAVGIAVSVLLIKVLADWGERHFVGSIEKTLNDAGHIVNEEKLPEAWLQPFRERIEAIHRKGGPENKADRVGHQARRRCLRNLDSLIEFFQKRNVTDNEQTRQLLLTSLRQQRDRVASIGWQELLAPEADTQEAAEPTDPQPE